MLSLLMDRIESVGATILEGAAEEPEEEVEEEEEEEDDVDVEEDACGNAPLLFLF